MGDDLFRDTGTALARSGTYRPLLSTAGRIKSVSILSGSYLKGKFTQNSNFISRSVLGAESNGEGPRCMR